MAQVDAEPIQTDANKFVFNIASPELVNHFVVFLLGTQPLDQGYGAAVYVCWPASEGDISWSLAGMPRAFKNNSCDASSSSAAGFISNEKPSAIFRLGKNRADQSSGTAFAAPTLQTGYVQVGVSIEPLDLLAQQTPVFALHHHHFMIAAATFYSYYCYSYNYHFCYDFYHHNCSFSYYYHVCYDFYYHHY